MVPEGLLPNCADLKVRVRLLAEEGVLLGVVNNRGPAVWGRHTRSRAYSRNS